MQNKNKNIAFSNLKLQKSCSDILIENNTWVCGNTRFISSVEHDISRVSAANE